MLLVDMNNWAAALGCAVAPSWWTLVTAALFDDWSKVMKALVLTYIL